MTHHVGYLGPGLIFHLSSGREIRVEGTASRNKIKHFETKEAPAGQQIYDLVFNSSILADIVAAPISGTLVNGRGRGSIVATKCR